MSTFPSQPVPHRIERTGNRHSSAVCRDDAIVIRLAGGLSIFEEQRHIETLLKRLTKAFVRMQQKTSVNPFSQLLNGEPVVEIRLVNGSAYQYSIITGHRLRANRTGSATLLVTAPERHSKRALHSLMWQTLAACEYERTLELVRGLNRNTINADIGGFSLRFASSKWGSCVRNRIMLNAALLFVPVEVLEYVALHELVHIVHPNHSYRFWDEVEKWMPDYREKLKKLKGYRLGKL